MFCYWFYWLLSQYFSLGIFLGVYVHLLKLVGERGEWRYDCAPRFVSLVPSTSPSTFLLPSFFPSSAALLPSLCTLAEEAGGKSVLYTWVTWQHFALMILAVSVHRAGSAVPALSKVQRQRCIFLLYITSPTMVTVRRKSKWHYLSNPGCC